MQTLYYVHEIKWAVLIFMLVSYSDRATAEDEIASPPVALLPQSSGTRVNPVMAIVLVSLLSVFFMICVISAYFRHYAERHLRLASTTHGSETGSMRSTVHGLDPAVIASFASFLYSSVKGIKIGQTVLECAVCLNEFQDHETLRLLPKCSHVFHRECIDTWLVSHVTCPVCRADLVLGPGETSHASEPHGSVDPDRDFASTEFLLPIEAKHIIPPTTDMPRSHSTGHSVAAQPVENIERYTLRLPNEAHGLFVNLGTSLPTSPHIAFPLESSEKKTFRSISVGSTRRLDFIQYDHSNLGRGRGETSRSVPSSSHVASHGNDLAITTNSQQLFRSARSPFDLFFRGSNRNFDVDERSTDNVTPDVEV